MHIDRNLACKSADEHVLHCALEALEHRTVRSRDLPTTVQGAAASCVAPLRVALDSASYWSGSIERHYK